MEGDRVSEFGGGGGGWRGEWRGLELFLLRIQI